MWNIIRKPCFERVGDFLKSPHKTVLALNYCDQKLKLLSEFPINYKPELFEMKWYQFWVDKGYFYPNSKETSETFSMVVPPPNVTGNLHLGHAVTITIQDALARWHRMKGHNVLWVPGFDHAGIATQVVVERKLMSEKGLKRHDIGREKFVEEVSKWKNERINDITHQFKMLGASLNFNRTCFTMDDKFSLAVRCAFIQLFEEGLIYRSEKLVNWSGVLQSVVSDIEVNHLNIARKTKLKIPGYEHLVEFGVMDYFAYPIEGKNEEIVVATTRLETMLGDVAIAVNPTDSRYSHLIGQRVCHPITKETLPIIADESVTSSFGTGAVKITPAHDPNDYAIAQRHKLKLVEVFDDFGCVKSGFNQFEGMHRFKARSEIRNLLREIQLHREVKPHETTLPICSRSGDVIEPRIKPQWFLKCSEFANKAMQDVENGSLKFYPDYHALVWKEWLSNIEDWCISRQLWWGHQIPIYNVLNSGENACVAAHNHEEALVKAKKLYGDSCEVKQDEDVLDTWFSSALFPIASLGWPNKSEDYHKFYPLSLMETGHDILFFWVSRMVMLCSHFTHQNPFNEVLLHGILCDSTGKKMSKSAGNSIDPMDFINGTSLEELSQRLIRSHNEGALSKMQFQLLMGNLKTNLPQGIPPCSADSLRLALSKFNIKTQGINFDALKVISSRHFCNKIWQSVRFYLKALETANLQPKIIDKDNVPANLQSFDLWILHHLAELVNECDAAFKNYDFHIAVDGIQQFWVKCYCDVYLELVKKRPDEINIISDVMSTCLYTILKTICPFTPFLSEEIYQSVFKDTLGHESITMTSYPDPKEWGKWLNPDLGERVDLFLKVAHEIRSLKQSAKATRNDTAFVVSPSHVNLQNKFNDLICHLKYLSRAEKVEFVQTPPENITNFACRIVNEDILIYVKDGQIKSELARKQKFEAELEKLKKVMATTGYKDKASANSKKRDLARITYLENELRKTKPNKY